MKRALWWALVLSFSSILFSQEPKPLPLPIIRLDDGSIVGIGPLYTHGMGYWLTSTEKVAILAGQEENSDVLSIALAIRNDSTEPIHFDPAQIQAMDLVGYKFLKFIPGKQLASKIRTPGFWARFAIGASRGAAMGAQETYRQDQSNISGDFRGHSTSGGSFSGNFDGTVTTGRMTCDAGCVAAKEHLLQQFAEQDAYRAANANAVEQTALEKETIMPGKMVQGYIYFSKPKRGNAQLPSGKGTVKSTNVVLLIPLGGEKFRFNFPTALWDELWNERN